MSARRVGAVVAALAAGLAPACTSLPWGSGGPAIVAVEREIPGGLVRHLGPDALARASERLALAVAERWELVSLPESTLVNGLKVAWDGLAPELGAVALALGEGGLEVHVELAAPPAPVSIGIGDVLACTIDVSVGPGTWIAPLQLSADKLGRVQGALQAAVRFEGSVYLGSADGPCPELADLSERIAKALATATGDVLGEALAAALAPSLGLDLALTWSGSISPDALGTGFLRASVRARESDVLTLDTDGVLVRFAVGLEAEPHPCMAPLTLPPPEDVGEPLLVPRGEGASGALLVRLAALEQVLAAAWVSGMACGDHADGGGDVVAGDLADVWPALAGYAPETPLRLELWPEDLPTLSPGEDGGLRVDTGRIVVEVWAEDGGTWRVGTLVVSLAVEGELTATPDGFVWLDPSRVEAWPSEILDGLVPAPASAAAAAVLGPLVESLVLARPVLRLPASARPSAARVLDVGVDHVLLVP